MVGKFCEAVKPDRNIARYFNIYKLCFKSAKLYLQNFDLFLRLVNGAVF